MFDKCKSDDVYAATVRTIGKRGEKREICCATEMKSGPISCYETERSTHILLMRNRLEVY